MERSGSPGETFKIAHLCDVHAIAIEALAVCRIFFDVHRHYRFLLKCNGQARAFLSLWTCLCPAQPSGGPEW